MRIKLINFRGQLLTEDTAQAVVALEKMFAGAFECILVKPQPTDDADPLSLMRAGREVLLQARREGDSNTLGGLSALWGHAVPLGFTPWARHPVPCVDSDRFMFYGPWQPLVDRLLSEGRGHLAWPSLCAAAQVDAGRWDGSKPTERFIQAQLHRVGYNCGPIDGNVGPRTAASIEALGLVRASLEDVKVHLLGMQEKAPTQLERRTGSLQLPGQKFQVGATGGIKVVRNNSGVTLTIDGPGRLVVDIGG